MSRGLNAGVLMLVLATGFMSGESLAFAASRPIEQLPEDVVRVSTSWMVIPKDMVEVGREHGPLAALTWGPAKGMSTFVRSTVSEIWDTVKPDKKRSRLASRGRSQGERPHGMLFRYEF